MTPWLAAIGLFVWAVLVADTLLRGDSRLERRALIGALLVGTCAFVVRYVFVVPSFVHANLHGASLVDSVLAFPGSPTHRIEYGPVGFAWLGAIAATFGDDFDALRAANCAFSSIAVTFAALFARSITDRDAVGVATALFGIASVPLMRIANSEDVHNVGLALVCVGLHAADVHFKTGSRRALALATCSIVAMLYARQTFFVFLPVFLALALGRKGRTLLRMPAVIDATLLVGAVALTRVYASLTHSHDTSTYNNLFTIVSAPGFVVTALGRHALLDVVRFGPFATLMLLVGIVYGVRDSRMTRTLIACFGLAFVVTIPFAFPSPGVQFSFRLPAILLGTIVSGLGGGFAYDQISRAISPGAPRALLAVASATLVLGTPWVTPSRDSLTRPSSDFVQYDFLVRHLDVLPRDAAFVVMPHRKRTPAYAPSRSAIAARPDVRLVESTALRANDDAYFLVGVQCWAHSFAELGAGRTMPDVRSPAAASRLVRTFIGGRWSEAGIDLPRGMRPECVELLRGSTPVGPQIVIEPTNDMPFAMYTGEPVTVGFRRLRPRP